MSEDKPQWPVDVLTKAAVVPHDKHAFQDQYMCDPWSDPCREQARILRERRRG